MTQAWTPEGFDEYRTRFPATPARVSTIDRTVTERFIANWHAGPDAADHGALTKRAEHTTIVLVRGFLGNYMPRNLAAVAHALRARGFDAIIANNGAGATVQQNVATLARQLTRRASRDRLVFCGHSRGGVEALTLMAQHPELAARCDGVAGSQMPFGPSRVLGSILHGTDRASLKGPQRRMAEFVQGVGLRLLGAAGGGRELASAQWSRHVSGLSSTVWPFPVLQMVSWSVQPTAWLDSFHRRLAEISPGNAHDGQFYLDEALWPTLPHVLLPRIDHAQPAVGGFGFDHARYWTTLLATLQSLSQSGDRQ